MRFTSFIRTKYYSIVLTKSFCCLMFYFNYRLIFHLKTVTQKKSKYIYRAFYLNICLSFIHLRSFYNKSLFYWFKNTMNFIYVSFFLSSFVSFVSKDSICICYNILLLLLRRTIMAETEVSNIILYFLLFKYLIGFGLNL